MYPKDAHAHTHPRSRLSIVEYFPCGHSIYIDIKLYMENNNNTNSKSIFLYYFVMAIMWWCKIYLVTMLFS